MILWTFDLAIEKSLESFYFSALKLQKFKVIVVIMEHSDCASLCVARLEPQKQLAAPKKPAV